MSREAKHSMRSPTTKRRTRRCRSRFGERPGFERGWYECGRRERGVAVGISRRTDRRPMADGIVVGVEQPAATGQDPNPHQSITIWYPQLALWTGYYHSKPGTRLTEPGDAVAASEAETARYRCLGTRRLCRRYRADFGVAIASWSDASRPRFSVCFASRCRRSPTRCSRTRPRSRRSR
jgi:hypothetical protein